MRHSLPEAPDALCHSNRRSAERGTYGNIYAELRLANDAKPDLYRERVNIGLFALRIFCLFNRLAYKEKSSFRLFAV